MDCPNCGEPIAGTNKSKCYYCGRDSCLDCIGETFSLVERTMVPICSHCTECLHGEANYEHAVTHTGEGW